VVADSACDLPRDAAREAGIAVVPLNVTFGTTSYLDGVDITPAEFWERVAQDHPTTSSPSPEAFLRAYRAQAEEGAEGVVSVHVSGALSRTLFSARKAAEASPVPVEVVDSGSVSLGQGLIALAAAEVSRAGEDLTTTAAAARAAAERLTLAAMLETVEFLKRGGRVGRARAAVADLLRIRPVLTLDGGEPVLAARARTRSRAIATVLELVSGEALSAAVLHAQAGEAQAVAEGVAEACGVRPIVAEIGPVTGTHLGPGALGVAVIRPPID
jgi:DegV family protein with EDD domain